jgi:hypothetical protein
MHDEGATHALRARTERNSEESVGKREGEEIWDVEAWTWVLRVRGLCVLAIREKAAALARCSPGNHMALLDADAE